MEGTIDMAPCQDWLTDAAHTSLADFELTDEIDRDLSARAVAARNDPALRDALFACLAGKVERFSRRFRTWDLAPWTFDDVIQETYLAYVATLHSWRPIDSGGHPAGFARYFLRVYPLRLSDHVRRLLGTSRSRATPRALPLDLAGWPDPLSFESQIDTLVALDAARAPLAARDGLLVELRVVADAAPEQIAACLGASERTLRRRWARVAPVVRERWVG
jgi:DNA-directed RNA polymerase specialized sigma24 family protein